MTVRTRNLLASLCVALISVSSVAGDVLIHEFMSHPSSEVDSEEYIELKNIGATSVDLTGWEFTRGVSFAFPNVTLAAGGYLVVAADTTVFESTYSVTGALGNWTGSLSNRGERLTLVDNFGDTMHDLNHADQGDWAKRIKDPDTDVTRGEDGWVWQAEHDGAGASLELTNTSLPSATDQGVLWGIKHRRSHPRLNELNHHKRICASYHQGEARSSGTHIFRYGHH